MLTERASAKINLCLHVIGRRVDGYHDIESLMVFTDAGDVLSVTKDAALSLSVTGPYAHAIPADDSNLVLKAARMLAERYEVKEGAALTLEKHLPVASGMGGGSADAAAALRLLARFWELPADNAALARLALSLGSDIPACLRSEDAWAEGLGEKLTPVELPPLHLLLVNPGVAVLTADVFKALRPPYRPSVGMPPATGTVEALAAWLTAATRNDLAEAALALAPAIEEVLQRLSAQPGCLLARMSGSGATCFGLFGSASFAQQAFMQLSQHQGWWVQYATVGDRHDQAQ